VDDGHRQEEYIRQVLEAYRKTPGTMGTVRRADRMLAAQLCQRGVAVSAIENAFVLAAARRLMRPADANPHAFGVDNTAGSFQSHKNTPSAWIMAL
jgi:hypothetical protein